jgi:hypothetical protein
MEVSSVDKGWQPTFTVMPTGSVTMTFFTPSGEEEKITCEPEELEACKKRIKQLL